MDNVKPCFCSNKLNGMKFVQKRHFQYDLKLSVMLVQSCGCCAHVLTNSFVGLPVHTLVSSVFMLVLIQHLVKYALMSLPT